MSVSEIRRAQAREAQKRRRSGVPARPEKQRAGAVGAAKRWGEHPAHTVSLVGLTAEQRRIVIWFVANVRRENEGAS